MRNLLVCLLALFFINSNAQNPSNPTPKKFTFEEKVEVLFKRLTNGINLEAAQKEKIKPLVENIVRNREAAIQELKNKKTSNQPMTKEELAARRTKKETEEAAFKAEMKKILTAQQYAQFEELLTRKRATVDPSNFEKAVDIKP